MRHLLLLLILVACAGELPTEKQCDMVGENGVRLPCPDPVDDPGFAGFVDDDEREEYCANNPDYIGCGELGQATQALTSYQYHGVGSDGVPCYSTRSIGTVGTCTWPATKFIRLMPGNVSPITADYTFEQRAYVSGIEEAWIRESVHDAVFNLQNLAGMVISETQGTQIVHVIAMDPENTELGLGGLIGGFQTRVTNGPVAPNGEDEAALRTATTGLMSINWRRIAEDVEACPGGRSEQNVRMQAYNVAQHEFLHTMGFSHFRTGLMRLNASDCPTNWNVVPQGFLNAITVFNATSAGANIQPDLGLAQYLP